MLTVYVTKDLNRGMTQRVVYAFCSLICTCFVQLVCDLKTSGVLCTFYNPTLKCSSNLVVKAVKAANDASGGFSV